MVKLSTGREINDLSVPTRKEALKLKIASASGYTGYDVFWDAAAIGLRISDKELEEYKDEEILEIAGLVFEKMSLTSEQKKS